MNSPIIEFCPFRLIPGPQWLPDRDPERWPDLLRLAVHPGISRLSRRESHGPFHIATVARDFPLF